MYSLVSRVFDLTHHILWQKKPLMSHILNDMRAISIINANSSCLLISSNAFFNQCWRAKFFIDPNLVPCLNLWHNRQNDSDSFSLDSQVSCLKNAAIYGSDMFKAALFHGFAWLCSDDCFLSFFVHNEVCLTLFLTMNEREYSFLKIPGYMYKASVFLHFGRPNLLHVCITSESSAKKEKEKTSFWQLENRKSTKQSPYTENSA